MILAAIFSAFWLGILTAISPCPLATNIAAISFIGRKVGQKKHVMVHKFITLGTLEERIDQMIEDKQKMADSIIGNDESWLTKLDNQAFKELIALNKNSIMEA